MSHQYSVFCPCCNDLQDGALSRRRFMTVAAGGAAALALLPHFAYAKTVPTIA
jgi:hypothetical protein